MVKNKTSDCLDNGISPTDEQNPIEGIEVENIIDGVGDDEEMGNMEQIFSSFLVMTLLNGYMMKMQLLQTQHHFVLEMQVVITMMDMQ